MFMTWSRTGSFFSNADHGSGSGSASKGMKKGEKKLGNLSMTHSGANPPSASIWFILCVVKSA